MCLVASFILIAPKSKSVPFVEVDRTIQPWDPGGTLFHFDNNTKDDYDVIDTFKEAVPTRTAVYNLIGKQVHIHQSDFHWKTDAFGRWKGRIAEDFDLNIIYTNTKTERSHNSNGSSS